MGTSLDSLEYARNALLNNADYADTDANGSLSAQEISAASQNVRDFVSTLGVSAITLDRFESQVATAHNALRLLNVNNDDMLDDSEAVGASAQAVSLRSGAARTEPVPRRQVDDVAWPILGGSLRLSLGGASPVTSGAPSLAFNVDASLFGAGYAADAVALSVSPHVGLLHRHDFAGDTSRTSGYAAVELRVGSPSSNARDGAPGFAGRVAAGFSFGHAEVTPHLSAGLEYLLADYGLTAAAAVGVEYMYSDGAHAVLAGVHGTLDVLGMLLGAPL